MKEVITEEVAKEMVDKWLDYKRVTARKRVKNATFIEAMISAVMDGLLVLDDKFNLVYTLLFESGINSLTFRPRINTVDLDNNKTGTAETSGDRLIMYISTLTQKSPGIIKLLDTEDLSLCQAIAVFFVS